jgi:hypothetical protein
MSKSRYKKYMTEAFINEADEDRYVHVGGGVYKEKDGKGQPLPNSPKYLKKDNGGFEMVDDDDPRLKKGDDKEKKKPVSIDIDASGGFDPEKPDDEPSDMDTERPDDEPEDDDAFTLDQEIADIEKEKKFADKQAEKTDSSYWNKESYRLSNVLKHLKKEKDAQDGKDAGAVSGNNKEVERDKDGVPEDEMDFVDELDDVVDNYKEMKDNYEQSQADGDPDDPEEKEQMDLDRVEYRKAEDKLRKYKTKAKRQGWDDEEYVHDKLYGESIKVINGKKYKAITEDRTASIIQHHERELEKALAKGDEDEVQRLRNAIAYAKSKQESVKESVNKRVTVKEVKSWLKGLEEFRYRKIPGVDVRRITSFVNNGLSETDLPKSLQKKWENAKYSKEKGLADRFMKERINKKLTQNESKHPIEEQYDRLFKNKVVL